MSTLPHSAQPPKFQPIQVPVGTDTYTVRIGFVNSIDHAERIITVTSADAQMIAEAIAQAWRERMEIYGRDLLAKWNAFSENFDRVMEAENYVELRTEDEAPAIAAAFDELVRLGVRFDPTFAAEVGGMKPTGTERPATSLDPVRESFTEDYEDERDMESVRLGPPRERTFRYASESFIEEGGDDASEDESGTENELSAGDAAVRKQKRHDYGDTLRNVVEAGERAKANRIAAKKKREEDAVAAPTRESFIEDHEPEGVERDDEAPEMDDPHDGLVDRCELDLGEETPDHINEDGDCSGIITARKQPKIDGIGANLSGNTKRALSLQQELDLARKACRRSDQASVYKAAKQEVERLEALIDNTRKGKTK